MGRAWRIWLHPRRTRHELEALEKKAEEAERLADLRTEELQARLDDMSSRRDKLDTAVNTITKELIGTRKKLDDREAELTALRRELEECRADLEERNADLKEYEGMERALAEFEKKLDAVEAMKRHYEERIGRLRAKIISMKAAQHKPAAGETIDMTDSVPEPMRPDDPDSEWLLPLD